LSRRAIYSIYYTGYSTSYLRLGERGLAVVEGKREAVIDCMMGIGIYT